MIGKRVAKLLIIVCLAFLFASFMFSSLSSPVKAAASRCSYGEKEDCLG